MVPAPIPHLLAVFHMVPFVLQDNPDRHGAGTIYTNSVLSEPVYAVIGYLASCKPLLCYLQRITLNWARSVSPRSKPLVTQISQTIDDHHPRPHHRSHWPVSEHHSQFTGNPKEPRYTQVTKNESSKNEMNVIAINKLVEFHVTRILNFPQDNNGVIVKELGFMHAM